MSDSKTDHPPVTRSLTAIIGVAGVVFISKLLGLAREVVVADRFGTSAEYDLYLIAIMLPALAYGIINFASYYLLVPRLTRYLQTDPADSGWPTVWGLFNRSLLLALGIAGLIVFSAPLVMKIWAGDYGDADYSLVVHYARVVSLMVVLGTAEAYLRALLNVRGVFTWPAGGYIVENSIFILSVVLLHDLLGVGAIVIGLLGGMLGQNLFLAVRLIPVGGLSKYRVSLAADRIDGMVGTILLLLAIELINRSYFLFDRYVAADFGVGIISSLNYSQVLVQLPDAVVGFAIASVVFPRFASANLAKDSSGFANLYRNAIVGGMLLTVPLAAFFFVNAADLIQVVFLRGRFDASSVTMTATLLRPYTPTIVALFIISTSLRAAYGQEWVRQVFWIAIVALVVKAGATLLLPSMVGFQGITYATSMSQLILAFGLLWLCLSRVGSDNRGPVTTVAFKLLLAGGLTVVAGSLWAGQLHTVWSGSGFSDALIRLIVSGVGILLVFLAAALLLGFRPYLAVLFIRKYVS